MHLSCRLIIRQWHRKSTEKHTCLFQRFLNRKPLGTVRPYSYVVTAKSKKVKLHYPIELLNPKIEEILAPLRSNVKEQGDLVRQLKANGASESDIKKAVAELKARKKLLDDKQLALTPASATFDRGRMEDLLKRQFFFDQSCADYGGITGFFDFGPMGVALKANILSEWRKFFVLEEQMLEVDCPILIPEPILKASGHVDRFADLMVKDLQNGECFRLDQLIKDHLEKVVSDKETTEAVREECIHILMKLDSMSKDEMVAVLKKFNMTSPISGSDLTEPVEFNLMFRTQIGPTGFVKCFLRPETAQGIFLNFKRLLRFNQNRVPFAAAQIGSAFRNEILPRPGLIRMREFTMAEIEHFSDPDDKSHPKFDYIKDTPMLLYSACYQMDGKSAETIKIGDAVASGLVANETLGYFMARIQLFLLKVGVDPCKLRFRQHMGNEMAHYACDCWDAECLTSYGWIECVGCADRSTYDLTQHTKASGVKLVAEKKLTEPKLVNVVEAVPNRGLIGKTFKKDAKNILASLAALTEFDIHSMEADFKSKGYFDLKLPNESICQVKEEMVTVTKYEKTVYVEEITPSVIEPSFGVSRIMYAIFEHNFKMREGDGQRYYFSFAPIVAPLKCSVLPLGNNAEFTPFIQKISRDLTNHDVYHKVDESSGSIGRKYARTDEMAIPFGITIDFDTLKTPHSVTLRERDSMKQVRINIDELPAVVRDLSCEKITWEQVEQKYPKFEQKKTV